MRGCDIALIVSLLLDDAAQARFDALRRAHFPPERLVVGAHLTMFHALPDDREQVVTEDVRRAAARPGFAVEVTGVRSLGRGVAFTLAAPELSAVRGELAAGWAPWLTAQDRQRFSPHITVQNKVTPPAARALLEQLSGSFVPFRVRATGLGLWRYLGGPWGAVDSAGFSTEAGGRP